MTDTLHSADTESESSSFSLTRRAFIGGSATVVALFALDAAPGSKMAKALAASLPTGSTGGTINGWISVNADNSVNVAFGGAEMGQGIMTGLAQAAAEELLVDWSQVRSLAAPAAQSYVTGGSWGVRANFRNMRIAGAQAREVLVAAADFAKLPPPSNEEVDMLDFAAAVSRTSRLACQIVLGADLPHLTVRIPGEVRNMQGR